MQPANKPAVKIVYVTDSDLRGLSLRLLFSSNVSLLSYASRTRTEQAVKGRFQEMECYFQIAVSSLLALLVVMLNPEDAVVLARRTCSLDDPPKCLRIFLYLTFSNGMSEFIEESCFSDE